MQLNVPRDNSHIRTAEDAPAYPHLTSMQQLRRSVLSCLLWESEFYESGLQIGERITALSAQVSAEELGALAIEARTEHHLRHVPLLLAAELAKRGGPVVADTLSRILLRADEVAEFLAVYWRDGKTPIAKQVKKGLAAALQKFDAYQLAKYDREKAIRVRDVMFMVHAKPKDEAQAALWKQLADQTLPAPDTWEVALSAGADKRETFERLLREKNLGYLALLRNLRNMSEAGVDEQLIRAAILERRGANRVLPFRYTAAARACPRFEPYLDEALSESISAMPVLSGRTIVLVDVSDSMNAKLSAKSDLTRMDAAATLGSIIHGDLRVFTFSSGLVEVPPRRGMAGVDAIIRSQVHNSTNMAAAVAHINDNVPHDRLIVITDEQVTNVQMLGGRVPDPVCDKAYMINVASNKHGVGYGKWTHIDGFSEGVLRWIHEVERDAG